MRPADGRRRLILGVSRVLGVGRALGLGPGLGLGLGLGLVGLACSAPASPPASPTPAPVGAASDANALVAERNPTATATATATPGSGRSSTPASPPKAKAKTKTKAKTPRLSGEADGDGDTPADDTPADSAAKAKADPLGALLTQTPRCTDPEKRCFGVHLHIVTDDDGAPVQELEWVSAQIAGAQDRFMSSVDASFEVIAVDALASDKRDIVSRLDRDRLGRPHFSRGVVHVFVVGSLANVDDPGEIRGVHWRDRSNTARRWVILSSIAGSMTLTHELGHFFSLPHSSYAGSLMNKRPGGPPFAERGFHPKEAARMRRAKAAMLADGMLKARPVPGSAAEPESPSEAEAEPKP